MIVASIDIGSNTVLLLVAEVNLVKKELKTIANYYRVPRVSKGLKPGSKIPEIKINELMKVLNEYKKVCNDSSAEKVIVNATNAFRIASNSDDITTRIRNELGWEVKVINGDTEARLSFLGSVFPIPDGQHKTVIDIGGGSTEIIYGNSDKIDFKKSFQTGVVSLTEKILQQKPVSQQNFAKAENEVKQIFGDDLTNIPDGTETVAVAGTPTTLSCIKQNIELYDEAKVDDSILTYDEIYEITKEISLLSPSEVAQRYGQVVEGREDILLAGCVILLGAMEKLGIDKIKVSSKGLRYGIIIDYMLNNN